MNIFNAEAAESRRGTQSVNLVFLLCGLCVISAPSALKAQTPGLNNPAFLSANNRTAAPSPTSDIFQWTFPNGSGATITAAVGPNGTTDCTWPVGKSGSGFALEGNGTSQEAQTVSAVTYGTNIITVSLFYDSDDVATVRILLDSSLSGGAIANSFVLYLSSAGTFFVYATGTTGFQQESVPALAAGYNHVLVVINQAANSGSGDILIYTNGVSATTTLTTPTKTGSANFASGTLSLMSLNSTNNWFDGRIDDVRIYSGDQSAFRTNIMNDPQ